MAEESIDEAKLPQLVIISGMSGAGRTEALHIFEDLGYFCVDNLPPALIGNLVEMNDVPGQEDGDRRICIVCDARTRSFFASMSDELKNLDASKIPYTIVFLDADDDKLIARYKSSRRRHPLCGDGASVSRGIMRERDLLYTLRERADLVINTTELSPAELRSRLYAEFTNGERRDGLSVVVYSFGFKHGLPEDSDLVMDVRYLPNPYYDPRLRYMTGFDSEVRDFVMYRKETEDFLKAWEALLDTVMPGYVDEGKQQLVIAVGCTGGQHRSVVLAEETGNFLRQKGYRVSVAHRDLALAERSDGTLVNADIESSRDSCCSVEAKAAIEAMVSVAPPADGAMAASSDSGAAADAGEGA